MADAPETPLPVCVTMPNLVVLGQTVRLIRTEFCRKIGPLASRLSMSLSLKAIEADTDQSGTYDSLLVIRSN